ncbi:MAG: hypothetical protein ACD_61C00007G0003 [uncultured bacterium]|nr:MAG: hypothetical protein ACD_61C00007G0003 [uncultured bacterium]
MEDSVIIENQCDGFVVKVLQSHVIGPKLKGMSMGKVFMSSKMKLRYNFNEVLYEVDKVDAYDESGNPVNIDIVPFDTENRVAAIIKREEQYLLIHRIKNDHEYYTFPGGHNKVTESLEETLSREIQEETGLTILPVALFYELKQPGFATEYFYLTSEKEHLKMKEFNPEVKPGEIADLIWVDISFISNHKNNILPNIVTEKLLSI